MSSKCKFYKYFQSCYKQLSNFALLGQVLFCFVNDLPWQKTLFHGLLPIEQMKMISYLPGRKI